LGTATVTELEAALGREDAAVLAAMVARTLGVEQAAAELRMSAEDLLTFAEGRVNGGEPDPTLVARVAGWATANSERLFRARGRPVPPFDYLADFWVNFFDGPPEPQAFDVERAAPSRRFVDFELSFPFGVPACPLTANSDYIGFVARHAFDLLTYKTVRDRPWPVHPFPQLAFALDAPEAMAPEDFDRPVTATLCPGADQRSLVNSFGVPSLKPHEWQADVERAKRALRRGQVLVVSVMGTPEDAADDTELARQFADAASYAAEAGADIVEVNLSCPNTGGEILCASPDTAARVVQAVATRLGRSRTPLFAKISYLPSPALRELVQRCGGDVQGIVGVNTVSVPVVARTGKQFFSGTNRVRGGVSGASIRALGLEVARNLVELREELFGPADWVVVAVGGVTTPEDFDEYLGLGVDAVQSCSGAWLDHRLALDIQARGRTLRS
jgi:dihydroorotate dehydrogenase